MKFQIIILAISIGSLYCEQKSYKNYSVLRTQLLTVSQAAFIKKLENDTNYDFWKPARPGGSADIMATGRAMVLLKKILDENKIHHNTMVPDVERLINSSKSNSTHASQFGARGLDWNDYYGHDTINEWMDGLANTSDWIHTVSIGKSFEDRDMRVIQLAMAGPKKPNVWIEAGIHAREWISPAMATYLLNKLVTTNQQTKLLDNLNIHVLPSANPDGYMYSMESDRMWRKTRSYTGSPIECKGVDGNRNWDFHFGESGTSNQKCSETYLGPKPFSEIEMRNIRDYVLKLDPTPILAECLHSYSQLWLYPFGYAYDVYPHNVEEIKALGEEAVEALYNVHGTVFQPINSAELYPASGASDDWYKGVLNARFAYTIELRDTGSHGFVLPSDQIVPSGEELWEAMKVVLNKMVKITQLT